MAKTYLPAQPGLMVWWLDEDSGKISKGAPIIAWLIDDNDIPWPITVTGIPKSNSARRWFIELADRRLYCGAAWPIFATIEDVKRHFKRELSHEADIS